MIACRDRRRKGGDHSARVHAVVAAATGSVCGNSATLPAVRRSPVLADYEKAVSAVNSDGRLSVTIQTTKARYEGIIPGLRGRHQIVNAATAIGLAESLSDRGFQIPQEAIIKGLENARHAGRLELLSGQPSLLFDGAHNPAAAKALADYLDEFVAGPVTLIFGATRDKDLKGILAPLLPRINQLVLTQPDNSRAANSSELRALVSGSFDAEAISMAPSAETALRRAGVDSSRRSDLCNRFPVPGRRDTRSDF